MYGTGKHAEAMGSKLSTLTVSLRHLLWCKGAFEIVAVPIVS